MIDIKKRKKEKSMKELLEFSIINIDKPSGPTSFLVSQFVKKNLGVSKTSHLGTLDPMVTGVLPVAISRACRLNEYLMHRDKKYVGIMRLHNYIEEKKLTDEIKNFIGKIKQLPPIRSRVKRVFREREIKSFKILEIDAKDVLFETEVQAGTYVRKLIHDLGEKIGGAHMLELRRTKAGIFDEKNLVDLYKFEKIVEEYKIGNEKPLREILIPGEIVANLLKYFFIKRDVLKKVLTGSPIFNNFLTGENKKFEKDEKTCAFCEGRFVGVYKVINGKDIFAVPEFVLN